MLRLATYGTLSPGKPNHHLLADLRGTWRRGSVRGRLVNQGWGAALGYPGLILDDLASWVHVDVFESAELALHWSRLDAFEGPGYRRVFTEVEVEGHQHSAHIYVVVLDELGVR